MPLLNGASRAAVSQNIRTLRHDGYPQNQAIAIALSHARKTGGSYGKEKYMENPSKGQWIGIGAAALAIVAVGSIFLYSRKASAASTQPGPAGNGEPAGGGAITYGPYLDAPSVPIVRAMVTPSLLRNGDHVLILSPTDADATSLSQELGTNTSLVIDVDSAEGAITTDQVPDMTGVDALVLYGWVDPAVVQGSVLNAIQPWLQAGGRVIYVDKPSAYAASNALATATLGANAQAAITNALRSRSLTWNTFRDQGVRALEFVPPIPDLDPTQITASMDAQAAAAYLLGDGAGLAGRVL